MGLSRLGARGIDPQVPGHEEHVAQMQAQEARVAALRAASAAYLAGDEDALPTA